MIQAQNFILFYFRLFLCSRFPLWHFYQWKIEGGVSSWEPNKKTGGSVWFSHLRCKSHFSNSNKRKTTQRKKRHDLKLFYHHKCCTALYSPVQLVSHIATIICYLEQSSLQITLIRVKAQSQLEFQGNAKKKLTAAWARSVLCYALTIFNRVIAAISQLK